MDRYADDIRFRHFRAISWLQIFVIIRLSVTIITGITAIPGLLITSIFSSMSNAANQAATTRVLLVYGFLAAMVGLAAAGIILFACKKKQFVPIYLVTVGLGIIFYLCFNTWQYALALACVESFFIAYLLTSKYMAVRFGLYNRLSRAALDAYAVRYDLKPETEGVIRRFEETAASYWRKEISPDEFVQAKAELLNKL